MSETSSSSPPAEPAVTGVSKPTSGRPFSARLPEEIGVLTVLVIMVAFISILRPNFLNPVNLLTLLGNTAFHGMIALGMVYLLAIRDIDLSVGWMFNFSAVITATLMVNGLDPWLAALGGVAFGA